MTWGIGAGELVLTRQKPKEEPMQFDGVYNTDRYSVDFSGIKRLLHFAAVGFEFEMFLLDVYRFHVICVLISDILIHDINIMFMN